MNYGCLVQHLIDKIACVHSELEALEKKATEMTEVTSYGIIRKGFKFVHLEAVARILLVMLPACQSFKADQETHSTGRPQLYYIETGYNNRGIVLNTLCKMLLNECFCPLYLHSNF